MLVVVVGLGPDVERVVVALEIPDLAVRGHCASDGRDGAYHNRIIVSHSGVRAVVGVDHGLTLVPVVVRVAVHVDKPGVCRDWAPVTRPGQFRGTSPSVEQQSVGPHVIDAVAVSIIDDVVKWNACPSGVRFSRDYNQPGALRQVGLEVAAPRGLVSVIEAAREVAVG